MKKISVYVKGDISSPSYYRIYQYINKLKEYDSSYNMMIPRSIYHKFMPIGKKPLYIQGLTLVIIYVRNLYFLLRDLFKKPDLIIISRRIISRVMPISYKLLLKLISKKVPIIWDYDDDIIEGKEVSKSTFIFLAKISNTIFCTHSDLRNLIPEQFRTKAILLPTTDGDMYERFNPDITKSRIKSLENNVNLVWVATSVNIPSILSVSPVLDKAACIISNKTGRPVNLSIVCDAPLKYDFKYLTLNNVRWSREEAIRRMLEAHIGLMPLVDNRFSKGKGGFKLVQYISIGLPCIASNVGFNKKVLDKSCGRLVNNPQEWIDALSLLSDKNFWKNYSINAYEKWNKDFSFKKNLSVWQEELLKLTKSDNI